jgi:hypothetical protein
VKLGLLNAVSSRGWVLIARLSRECPATFIPERSVLVEAPVTLGCITTTESDC